MLAMARILAGMIAGLLLLFAWQAEGVHESKQEGKQAREDRTLLREAWVQSGTPLPFLEWRALVLQAASQEAAPPTTPPPPPPAPAAPTAMIQLGMGHMVPQVSWPWGSWMPQTVMMVPGPPPPQQLFVLQPSSSSSMMVTHTAAAAAAV